VRTPLLRGEDSRSAHGQPVRYRESRTGTPHRAPFRGTIPEGGPVTSGGPMQRTDPDVIAGALLAAANVAGLILVLWLLAIA